MPNIEKNRPVTALFSGESNARALAPVAVMDSGVGGLYVLREIRKLLPREQLLYFGDSANAPYGERPEDEVRELIFARAARLLEQAKAMVLACNTATALAAAELRRRYPQTPIVGMEPALKPAVAVREHPRVLVLATPTTLRERKFAALRKKYEARAEILPVAAPVLVRFVEAGETDGPALRAYLADLLAPYLDPRPDAVVLGCTHFSFAKEAISRTVGGDIPLFDGAAGTAAQLVRRLAAAGLLTPSLGRGSVTLTSSKAGVLPLYVKLLFAP